MGEAIPLRVPVTESGSDEVNWWPWRDVRDWGLSMIASPRDRAAWRRKAFEAFKAGDGERVSELLDRARHIAEEESHAMY